jgi:hypothetical protein
MAVFTWYSARPTPPTGGCQMPVVICTGLFPAQVSACRKTAKKTLMEGSCKCTVFVLLWLGSTI